MYRSAITATLSHTLSPSPTQPTCGRRIQLPLPYSLTLEKSSEHFQSPGASVLSSGLRTPPADEMGTTYHAPNLAPYENHNVSLPGYPSALAQADRTRTVLSDINGGLANSARYSAQNQPQPHSQTRLITTSSSSTVQPSSRHSTRPSTPTGSSSKITMASEGKPLRRDSLSLTLHSMTIPSCISPNGGNIADFAAQVTCLLWFESPKVLEAAENVRSLPATAPIRRLTEHAIPSQQFTKWVQAVFTTTQIAQNVMLLALMFIYRLKMTNPNVKGQSGSEYRLLTVALMLGNKFLDDNTYTNKTWADVSGISVQEIHVMEVEFLSNMRYSLLASKEHWDEWLLKLAHYFEYCERAMKPLSPILMSSPTHRGFASPLPSPTNNVQLTPLSTTAYSPSSHNLNNGQNWPVPYQAAPALSPLASRPDLGNNRKRSLVDEELVEPPAKRPPRHQPQLSQGRVNRPTPNPVPEAVRLSIPNLTLNTGSVPPATQAAYPASVTYAPQQQSALSLPPLVPGVRAMATVFPTTTTTTFPPQLPLLSTNGLPGTVPSVMTTPTTHYPPATSGYGTPTKRLSPVNTLTPAAAYGTSSPLTEAFPHHSGLHTPISHSPSVYLQQRPSPYRPVRHVNTLLYPPPSASLQEYHLSGTAIPPTQMHYQPLGRRNDIRTGIVPEFRNGLLYSGNGLPSHSLTPIQTVPGQQRLMPLGQGQYPN